MIYNSKYLDQHGATCFYAFNAEDEESARKLLMEEKHPREILMIQKIVKKK